MNNDERVCSNCIGEEYLKLQVKGSTSTDDCSFCERRACKTLPISELAAFVSNMLEEHYQATASEPDGLELMAVKYGSEDWYQQGTPLNDLIEETVEVNCDVATAIADELKDGWFDWSSHEHQYGEDPHFEEARADTSDLGMAWSAFETRLLRETRLLDNAGLAMLDSIFGPATEDESRSGSVITDFNPGTDEARFFRARFFVDNEGLEKSLSDPEGQLGPPPPELALAGRLNAHGISVFYGAFSSEAAISEIRPPVGSNVLIGEFHPVVPLRLLDLTKLTKLIIRSSLFDPATKNRYARSAFLNELIKRITSPVLPHRVAHDYLVTQIIADYLAQHASLRLNGLIYPSTQAGKANSLNVMLFNAYGRVGSNNPIEKVTLYERDEDDWDFSPSIHESAPTRRTSTDLPRNEQREISLELKRDTLKVVAVTAVNFETKETPVYVAAYR